MWQQSISKTTARLREKNLTESHKKKQKQIKNCGEGGGFGRQGHGGRGAQTNTLLFEFSK